MYGLNITEEISKSQQKSMNAERLLRSLGASGRLVGFRYMVYIAEKNPCAGEDRFLTKCIYPDTAKHFQVGAASVEHAIRTLIRSCWERTDHSALDYIAGVHVEQMPTNSAFIDIVTAYLRYTNP